MRDPSDPIEVEICTNDGLLGLLHDLMSEVYQDALTDITWLTESDVAEVRLEAREALNQCGETTSCLQEVYFDTIDLLSIISVRFDARAQYQGFFYIPLDDEAECSDGYVDAFQTGVGDRLEACRTWCCLFVPKMW
mgnify:CR=1 FL=1